MQTVGCWPTAGELYQAWSNDMAGICKLQNKTARYQSRRLGEDYANLGNLLDTAQQPDSFVVLGVFLHVPDFVEVLG